MSKTIKLVVIGDGAVGKSCLLISYATGKFPSEYVPTVFDNWVSEETLPDGTRVAIALWDTAGQEDYDRLRPLSYPETDAFLVCFDIASKCSLENITEKWAPEVEHYCPDVPKIMVGCKKDLRNNLSDTEVHPKATTEECKKIADKLGYAYFETSALTREGVGELFKEVVSIALAGKKHSVSRSRRLFKFLPSLKSRESLPEPPVMPPAGQAPWIEIETSVFADDWQKALEKPQHSDVTFIVESRHRLQAHRIILSCASTVFAKIFDLHQVSGGHSNQLALVAADSVFCWENINQGMVPGISQIYEEQNYEDLSMQTFIELSPDIDSKTFVHVLEFLYTGLPKISEETTEEELDSLINASHIFKLGHLETICMNQKKKDDFLNPSIGTWLNDEVGKELKSWFFNKPRWSDVVFKVEGQRVYAHKVVMSARCEVMAAMFSGNFVEGHGIPEIDIKGISLENFLAFLEYLYTDHAAIEEGDSVGIMVLGDLYGQPRLVNLCELYITKEVERSVVKNIEKADIDVIGLLLTSQMHNASQLEKWCFHFVSSNYIAFKQRPEYAQLTGDNLEYIEKHQWPPLSYLKDVENYEKLLKEKGEKCVVM